MKHILPDRSARYRADESKYDTVYFNLADNTARGYCETAFKCGEDFNTDPVDLITTSFLIETPLDVIATLSSSAVESGSAMIGGKEVRIIEDTYKGMIRRTHIWTYRGIPLRYELYTAKGEKAAVIVEYE